LALKLVDVACFILTVVSLNVTTQTSAILVSISQSGF